MKSMEQGCGKGPLAGIRVLEIAGVGPAPFAGMLLADLGAEVIVLERPDATGSLNLGRKAILNRGKRSICVDLKAAGAADLVLRLLERCDALIEGMRPGVMERLGLGPDPCLSRNPRLVYGRMTGWGQDGPFAQCAGHDINYIALSGALWYAGAAGDAPVAPPTLVGDLGGGALYLAFGLLAGILHVRAGGAGQVVDAAIFDGSANLLNLLLAFHAAGSMPMERGRGLLDGSHWYGVYRCSDGQFLSVGAIEAKFYAEFLARLGLAGDPLFADPEDASRWPAARQRLTELFGSAPQAYWMALFAGGDACVAPVLDPCTAAEHPHALARQTYLNIDGILQVRAAPRFSAFPDCREPGIPVAGQDWQAVLSSFGLAASEIERYVAAGVVQRAAANVAAK